MSKKIIVPLVVVAIISFLIGFGFGKTSEKGIEQPELVQTREEIEWLKSQLEMFYPPLPEEVYSLSGTVTETGAQFLVMEAQIRVSQFPLPEGKEIERQNIKVNITDQTEIFKTEMAELLPPSPGELPSFEELMKKTALSFGDIKVGNYIVATSEENIRNKKEITAKEIQISD